MILTIHLKIDLFKSTIMRIVWILNVKQEQFDGDLQNNRLQNKLIYI